MKYLFTLRAVLTLRGATFLVATSLIALFTASSTLADPEVIETPSARSGDIVEVPAPRKGDVVEVPAPRPVDVVEVPLPKPGPLTDVALAPGPKTQPLVDVTQHRAPPLMDVTPHRAPPLTDVTPHRVLPLTDVTPHKAPRKKKHLCPDVFNIVELCIGNCGPAESDEPAADGTEPSGTTDIAAGGSTTQVVGSSTQPSKKTQRRKANRRDKKKAKRSSNSGKEDTATDPFGTGSGSVGAGSAVAQTVLTVVLTTPQLSPGESMALSRDQFLHFLLGGFKGEVSPSGSVAKIDITVLRQEGDQCFLIFPVVAVDCEGSAGEGRLLTRRVGDILRFAVRPLADSESGKHSSEVLDAVRGSGFLRDGRYVLSVKVTLFSGEVEVHKFSFDVK